MFLLFPFLISILYLLFYAEENCPKYQLIKERDGMGKCTNNSIQSIEVYSCPADSFCNFHFGVKENFSCTLNKKGLNAKCNDSEQCFFSDCVNKCQQGKILGDKCENHKECNYSLYCNNTGQCSPLLKENETCTEDEECSNEYGCFLKGGASTGKCIRYFSLNDNEDVSNTKNYKISFTDSTKIELDGRRFCRFFYAEEGKCSSLQSITGKDGKLVYRNRFYQEAKVNTTPFCGLDGEEHLNFVNGDSEFSDYLIAQKILYLNPEKCHTTERFQLCHEDIASPSNRTKNLVIYYTKKKMIYDNGKNGADYIKNNADIISVLYPVPNGSKNFTEKCPKYECKKKSKKDKSPYCLKTSVSEVEDSEINVTLYTNVCKDEEFCSLHGSDHKKAIMLGRNLTGFCEKLPSSQFPQSYPGEKCAQNSDCIEEKNCIDGVCEGKKLNENCTKDIDCIAGLYCSNNICQEQKEKDENCENSYACKNKYVCYNNTCRELFTLDPETKILSNDVDYFPFEFFCKFGTYDKESKKCFSFNSTQQHNEIDSINVFENCTYGQNCTYLGSNKKNYSLKCECGYNANGQGFCPLAHNQDVEIWNKFFKATIRKYDNKCHTLNRFNCKDSDKFALMDIKFYSHYLKDGHLFNHAVKCAIDVLKGFYFKNSFYLLGSFLFIIF